jgi:hypothetical protein
MSGDDLERSKLPPLDWSEPRRSLSTVFEHAIEHAEDAEDWYTRKRGPKKVGGQILRIGSIVLTGAAALIPLLSELFADEGVPAISPAWASVALVLAATLIAFDRYFGFSTGWTRFMTANLKIARLRRDFEFSWQEASAPRAGEEADPFELLKLAHVFVLAVDDEVADETELWTAEFQASIAAAARQLRELEPTP